MPQNTESTTFTRDLLGRNIAHTWQEAIDSQDAAAVPGARRFDRVVVGGGTFGCVLATRMFSRDTTRAHRILVLEAGPIALDEHVQNIAPLDTAELWGVAWNSDSPFEPDRRFPGLSYALGGRSLFWGGWSPPFIESELTAPEWPATLRDQLAQPNPPNPSYFDQAARQLGTDRAEDFVFGPLHEALKTRLFDGLRTRGAAQPALLGLRGTSMSDDGVPEPERRRQLDAPLAVQSAPERAGSFPFNKFSAMPMLINAACRAQAEAKASAPSDYRKLLARKGLMIVPNVHVIRLERDGDRVRRVVTNQGTLELGDSAQVFLALGTIENTRLALRCVPDQAGLIGRNLMAHLRSNLVIRIRREAFAELPQALRDLQSSALFVKGVHQHADGRLGHFHFQITASGTGASADSEIELFKRIPDIDGLDALATATDEWVVATIRGIGEMRGDRTANPSSRVTLGGNAGAYDYGEPRAMVRLQATPADVELWDEMDRASEEVALLLAAGRPEVLQYLGPSGWSAAPPLPNQRRDALSSTHHEAGTLWMGTDPASSVTNELGRFNTLANLFVTGPALLPRIGSPNPMLSGIALVRRLADAVVPAPPPPPLDAGEVALFDGTAASFAGWQLADAEPQFSLSEGVVTAESGSNLGLLFFARRTFSDSVLRLQFRITSPGDNAGVHVRFRDPRQPVPNVGDPSRPFVYTRKAYVAVTTGLRSPDRRSGARQPEQRNPGRTGLVAYWRDLRRPDRRCSGDAALHAARRSRAKCVERPRHRNPREHVHGDVERSRDHALREQRSAAGPARRRRSSFGIRRPPGAHRTRAVPRHPNAPSSARCNAFEPDAATNGTGDQNPFATTEGTGSRAISTGVAKCRAAEALSRSQLQKHLATQRQQVIFANRGGSSGALPRHRFPPNAAASKAAAAVPGRHVRLGNCEKLAELLAVHLPELIAVAAM